MNKKIIFKSFLILIWLIVIFFFSSFNSKKSTDDSKAIIKDAVINVINVNNSISPNKIELPESKIKSIVNKLNYPFRKMMHISEYFILSILIILLLKEFDIRGKYVYLIVFIACLCFATLDETHQMLVGRTGTYKDVFIDFIGVFIALLIYKYQEHLRKLSLKK